MTKENVFSPLILQKITTMKDKLSVTFSKRKVNCRRYYDINVYTLPISTIGEQAIADGPPLTPLADNKNTATWCNNLLLQTTEPFSVTVFKLHATSINENRTSNTIPIDCVVRIETRKTITKKKTMNLRSAKSSLPPEGTTNKAYQTSAIRRWQLVDYEDARQNSLQKICWYG